MVLNSPNFRNYCGRDATLQQWAWSGRSKHQVVYLSPV